MDAIIEAIIDWVVDHSVWPDMAMPEGNLHAPEDEDHG